LLLKNGVTVPTGASNQQIAVIIANLLRVSKSFAKDLNVFIQNPKVIQVIAGSFSQNAEYFRASGFAGKKVGNAKYFRADGFMNSDGGEDGFTDTSTTTSTTTSATTPTKTGFWSNLNLGNLLTQGLGVLTALDKNKTDRAIADAQVQISTGAGVGSGTGSGSGSGSGTGTPDDEGMSTTTVVVLSLVGIAVLGTIIYFIARPKK
jgi:hypothetical protein